MVTLLTKDVSGPLVADKETGQEFCFTFFFQLTLSNRTDELFCFLKSHIRFSQISCIFWFSSAAVYTSPRTTDLTKW